MTDVVNAYLGQAREFVQVGGPPTLALIDDLLPDAVTVRRLDRADHEAIHRAAGEPATVLALDLSPEGELDEALVDVLANRPPGARSVLLSARSVGRLPAQRLADQLSRAGQRCVHVVPVALDGGATRRSVVGTVALGDSLVSAHDNEAVLVAAVSEAQGSAALLDDVDTMEAALMSAAERAAVESHARNVAEAELVQRSAELAAARRQLRALRSSAAMQIGRGLIEVVQHPASGLRQLPGRPPGCQPRPWPRRSLRRGRTGAGLPRPTSRGDEHRPGASRPNRQAAHLPADAAFVRLDTSLRPRV